YPTLASQSVHVALGTTTGPVTISIMDLNGNIVYNHQYVIEQSNTVIVINEVADLPAGNYFVIAQGANNKLSKQFIKQ
ncbi:MAG TPA: T9SS type A sorting domain-containing protein, partial [Chitinophagales bacterium]|nr:T9SS type A sorting domain-containing protein [Chitinophagales bacterium]